MIGSLVKFIYADDEDNICVVMRSYDKDNMTDYVSDADKDDDDLYLVYDFKSKDYFYALENELITIYK